VISDRLFKMLHDQVGYEFHASHQYLAASLMCADLGLNRFAAFFQRQADEERAHGLKIVGFLSETRGAFVVPAVPAADPAEIKGVADAFDRAYASEQKVTAQFKAMAAAADEEKDPVARQFLDWFLVEQIEEENLMDTCRKMLASGVNLFVAESLLPEVEH
jgi:ferritin